MFEHKTEEEARKEILSMVEGYYEAFHKNKKEFKAGDRILMLHAYTIRTRCVIW